MSAEKVIVALLKANAGLTALVPVASIYPETVPQGAALPALAYTQVSGVELPNISGRGATTTVNSRIQVSVVTKSYPAKKTILAAVRAACNNRRGLIAGVPVLNVRRELVGPDLDNAELALFSQSVDFRVTFLETNP
ncbi:MAG: DUF3168 domain-containing protein [Comamonadaceae bacterium]|nr:MAG: DUF3168 domain-containing protein [Comamonadaceae bacterium]